MLIGGGSVLVKSALISVVGTDDVLSYDTSHNTHSIIQFLFPTDINNQM